MGPLETQMYVWTAVWLVLVIVIAVVFYNTGD